MINPNDYTVKARPLHQRPGFAGRFKSRSSLKTGTLLAAIFLPLGFVLFQKKPTPNNQVLSPLASGQPVLEAAAPKQRIYQPDYYISLSKSFIQKATRLANDNNNQTETDKQNILTTINESLKAANQAVELYPQRVEVYLNRAQICQKVQHLIPRAEVQAKQDLETAQKLTAGKPVASSPSGGKPLDLIPLEKASENSRLIIAAPEEDNRPKTQEIRSLETNALSGEAVIRAGETEVLIQNNLFTDKDAIYVTPKNSTDATLFVKSREPGQYFRVVTDKLSTRDLEFRWWIVK